MPAREPSAHRRRPAESELARLTHPATGGGSSSAGVGGGVAAAADLAPREEVAPVAYQAQQASAEEIGEIHFRNRGRRVDERRL